MSNQSDDDFFDGPASWRKARQRQISNRNGGCLSVILAAVATPAIIVRLAQAV